jgi:hypothetical protein
MNADTKVITTFGKTGKQIYGNEFIETFLKFWPQEIKLTIYSEDWSPNIYDSKIEYIDIDTAIPGVNSFRDFCISEMQQYQDQKANKRINWYNKAIRWSFKSFVIHCELTRKEKRYIIWLDGDVSTIGPIEQDIAKKLLKGNVIAGQIEYVKGQKHIESGIVVFDTEHPDCEKIIDHIKSGYIDMQVLTLPKPWDGFWLAKLLESNIDFTDMHKESSRGMKPFANKYIVNSLIHNVGKQKLKLNDLDLTTGRNKNESW